MKPAIVNDIQVEKGGRVRPQGKPACLSRVAGARPIASLLAEAGMGTSSQCEGMVRGGRVSVNGRRISQTRERADPFQDRIELDGQPFPLVNACRYLLLHKPYGVLCAFTDPQGRPTLADYVPVPGVYSAGRLDYDSEGLLLLTGDGWLIHRLGHPRYGHTRTYLVQVERVPDEEALVALRRGVQVKGRRTAPARVQRLSREPDLPPRSVPVRYRKTVPTAWLRVVLTEGKKRQVRRMTAAVGYPTLRLVRVGIGPLELGDLLPGERRDLDLSELGALRAALRSAASRQ
ncbi:pseudouridine synthase [Chloroflexota bacterium]